MSVAQSVSVCFKERALNKVLSQPKKHVSLKFSFTNCQRKHQFRFHVKFLSVYVTVPVEFLCYWKHNSLIEVYFHEISQETPIQVSCEVSLRLYNYDDFPLEVFVM